MKAISLLIAFTIISFVALSQTDSATSKNYHLKGKLIHQVDLPPYCGVLAFASAVKLEVLEYSEPNNSSETIVKETLILLLLQKKVTTIKTF